MSASMRFHFLFLSLDLDHQRCREAVDSHPVQVKEREKRKCTRAHAFLCSLSFAAAQVQRCLCWRAKWKRKRKASTSLYIIQWLAQCSWNRMPVKDDEDVARVTAGARSANFLAQIFLLSEKMHEPGCCSRSLSSFSFHSLAHSTSLTDEASVWKEEKEESAALLSNDMKAAYKFLFISLSCLASGVPGAQVLRTQPSVASWPVDNS